MATFTAKARNKCAQLVMTNNENIPRESIETAYCFFHQKERVYAHSTMEWQRDDIEYAIASFVDEMNTALYSKLSEGKTDFLRNHTTFHNDMLSAMEKLEAMMQ